MIVPLSDDVFIRCALFMPVRREILGFRCHDWHHSKNMNPKLIAVLPGVLSAGAIRWHSFCLFGAVEQWTHSKR